MSTTTKPSNPKDVIGSSKLDMGLVPWTLMVAAATAFFEGAKKYGRFNWRVAGVRSSIYHAATTRHIAKWWNGQDCDTKTRVHHLDNAIACLAILRDAELYGKLTDDRPPCPDPDAMADMIDAAAAQVAHLNELFKDHSPHQYTIADTPREDDTEREWTTAIDEPEPQPVQQALARCGAQYWTHDTAFSICKKSEGHRGECGP